MTTKKLTAHLLKRAFGQVLEERRKQLGLGRMKFAEMSGCDRSFIIQIEKGKSAPGFYMQYKIATALGIGLPHFVGLATARAWQLWEEEEVNGNAAERVDRASGPAEGAPGDGAAGAENSSERAA